MLNENLTLKFNPPYHPNKKSYRSNFFFNELVLKNLAINAFQPYTYSLRPFSRGVWDAPFLQSIHRFRPPSHFRVKVNLSLCLKYNLSMAYLIIWRSKKNKFSVAGNREYKETDSINFIQSSLKTHPLWVTLAVYRYYTIL